MRFNVYDMALNRIDIIPTWYSCLWNVKYNDTGSLTLELDARAYDYETLKPMKLITGDFSDHIFVTTSVDIKGSKAVINGFTADYLLGNKILLDKITGGAATLLLSNLYSSMQSSAQKKFPIFSDSIVNDAVSPTILFEHQKSNASMLDFLRVICQTCDIGYKTVLDTEHKKINLVLYQPSVNIVNRFSSKYGNIADEEYTISKKDYANVAVVLGQATDSGRVTVTVGDTNSTGTNRLEMLVDARDQQQEEDESDDDYEDRLRERGLEKLAEVAISESFDFSVLGDEDLGAMVQVELLRPAMKFATRIMEKEIKSQNNVVEKKITVGKAIL